MTKNYIIDISRLELGDIILTAEKGAVSKGVRVATLSKYSHAAIYVGGTIIEATLGGVFSKNPQRLIFDSENQVAVYRYRGELSEEQVKVICNYARSKVASLYTIPEALTLRIRELLKKPESRKQFCSRLVALSYSDNGIDLLNIRNPAYCTPKQLSLCKAFYKVSDIIREATESEVRFSKTEDPNIAHQKDTIEWVNKVRNLVSEQSLSKTYDIQSIIDVDAFLKFHPEFDSDIVSYMEAGGYLTHYNFDMKNNPHRYNLIWLESVAMKMRNRDEFLIAELTKELSMINLYSENLARYLDYFISDELIYYKKHCALYINLLIGIQVRTTFLGEVSNKIGNGYVTNASNEIRRVATKNIDAGKRVLGLK